MAFVTRLKAGPEIPNPTWELVADAIERLASGALRSLFLGGGEDAWMIVCHAAGHGFYVTAREDDEAAEQVLVEPSQGMELVETTIDGVADQQPRCALVPRASMLKATLDFYVLGKRSRDLTWRNPFDLEREGL